MSSIWRSEIVHICAAAMEAAWLSPALLIVAASFSEPGVVLTGLPLWALLYASRFLARRLSAARLDLGRSRLLIVYLAAFSMLLTLKLRNYPGHTWLSAAWLGQLAWDVTHLSVALGSVILTVGVVAFAWQRALNVSVEHPHDSSLIGQFQVGLVFVVVASFLAGRVGLGASFLPWLFWLFFWGMLAVAIARLDDIARARRRAPEAFWLPLVFAVIILVLVVGGLGVAASSRQILDGVRLLLQPIAAALELAIYLIALPISFLVELLLVLLRPLLGPLLEALARGLGDLRGLLLPIDGVMEEQAGEPFRMPWLVQEALKWLIIVIVMAGIFGLLARAVRRWHIAGEDDGGETRESVWSLSELLAALAALQRRLRGRGQGAMGRAREAAPTTAAEQAAQSVRRIYRRLLGLAASLGRPRPPARTPYEYAGELSALFAGSTADVRAITEAYVQARYSGVSSPQQVSETQQAWLRLRAQGQQLAAEQRRRAASH